MKTESENQKAEMVGRDSVEPGPGAFFFDDMRRSQLLGVARSWLRTPFHAHAGIKGAGVDCVHLCAAIYIECGVMEIFDPPKYALDGGQHAATSLVTQWVEGRKEFAPLVPYQSTLLAQVRPGDLVCFTIGRQEWHVGLMLTRAIFIHAQREIGVAENYLAERAWSRRLTRAYRPTDHRSPTTGHPL